MCTLIFWYRPSEDPCLVVAANRDERLDRPAAPPTRRQLSRRAVLCPTDLLAGGTWLGINDRRVFSAITNRFGEPKHPDRRSRGALVLKALDHAEAAAAADRIAALDPLRENAFHLAIADKQSAHLIVCNGRELAHRVLEPGLHVITERSFRDVPVPRENRIRSLLGDGIPDDTALTELLSLHDASGTEGTCVHLNGYGTRSSAILRMGDAVQFKFADGPPHETAYIEVEGIDGNDIPRLS